MPTRAWPPGLTRSGRRGESCRRRILVAPIDARLFAIDAATGAVCADFGEEGMIDLRRGLRRPPRSKDEYQTTSPPAILGEVVIIGSSRQRPDSDAERRSARVQCPKRKTAVDVALLARRPRSRCGQCVVVTVRG